VVTVVSSDSESTTPATINSQLTTDELLSKLLLAIDDLSKLMQKAERRQVTQQLAQVVLLSDAIRPKIFATSDQLAVDFDRVINLAKSSVERNRPADADKALRFLPLIIDALAKL
jgi:archaellum biogenesis ATPase FlaH